MKTYLGLLLKDILIFNNYKKNVIFTTITFIILIFLASIENNMLTYGTLLFVLMFGMNSISTFSYDEMSNTDEYLVSLPITRKELVLSKYLICLFYLLTSIIIGLFISVLASLIVRSNIDGIYDTFKTITITFTLVSFLMCADIPCIYKWGVEKGRMQAVLIPVLLVFIFGIIGIIIFLINPSIYKLFTNINIIDYIIPICLLLNVLFYIISYKVSYSIFKNKDL